MDKELTPKQKNALVYGLIKKGADSRAKEDRQKWHVENAKQMFADQWSRKKFVRVFVSHEDLSDDELERVTT